jgi:hypothetical protein
MFNAATNIAPHGRLMAQRPTLTATQQDVRSAAPTNGSMAVSVYRAGSNCLIRKISLRILMSAKNWAAAASQASCGDRDHVRPDLKESRVVGTQRLAISTVDDRPIPDRSVR